MGTTGFHLLLLVILFVGPAFFRSRKTPDDTPVLDIIPATQVDSVTTGVRAAEPPPAAAVVPPQPAPPAPTPPVVTPPTPAPVPKREEPEPVRPVKEPVKEPVKPKAKPEAKPVDKPRVTKPELPKVDLTLTTRTVPKQASTPAKTPVDDSKAIKSALQALRKNLSSATEIAPVGNSSTAAANYGQTVKSVYEQAWILPNAMDSDEANTIVRVTIASDGTVISARIITPSGDAKLDASVQRTLDRVQFIAPFPPGSTDTERIYIINFNPQIKRMNG